jgi:hypothetical protein
MGQHYLSVFGKSNGTRFLERCRRKWEEHITLNLKEDMNCFYNKLGLWTMKACADIKIAIFHTSRKMSHYQSDSRSTQLYAVN